MSSYRASLVVILVLLRVWVSAFFFFFGFGFLKLKLMTHLMEFPLALGILFAMDKPMKDFAECVRGHGQGPCVCSAVCSFLPFLALLC